MLSSYAGPLGGQLARVLAPVAVSALRTLAGGALLHTSAAARAAPALQQQQASEWFVVRGEERVDAPQMRHEEDNFFVSGPLDLGAGMGRCMRAPGA